VAAFSLNAGIALSKSFVRGHVIMITTIISGKQHECNKKTDNQEKKCKTNITE